MEELCQREIMNKTTMIGISGWGMRATIFEDLMNFFPNPFMTIDLPGVGEHRRSNWTQSDSLLGFIGDNCFINDRIVLGWSMGGMLALREVLWGNIFPKALVLIATGLQFPTDRLHRRGLREMQRQLHADVIEAHFYCQFARWQSSGDSRALSILPKIVQSIEPIDSRNRSTMMNGLAILSELKIRPIPNVPLPPILILGGAQDQVFTAEASIEIKNSLPQANLHIMHNSSHVPFLSHPEEVSGFIKNFFEQYKL